MWRKIRKEGLVCIRDTDATGRVFCPRPIEWVIEAFERECIFEPQEGEGIAIVRANVGFFSPFSWLNPYILELSIARVGNRSFDLKGQIFDKAKLAIEVDITFVLSGSSGDFLLRFWQKTENINSLKKS